MTDPRLIDVFRSQKRRKTVCADVVIEVCISAPVKRRGDLVERIALALEDELNTVISPDECTTVAHKYGIQDRVCTVSLGRHLAEFTT